MKAYAISRHIYRDSEPMVPCRSGTTALSRDAALLFRTKKQITWQGAILPQSGAFFLKYSCADNGVA